MDFSADLQDKLGEHNPSEIEELILDDLFQNIGGLSQEHKNGFEKYTSLIHLSLKNIGLESLANFPSIKTLQILEISNNKLTGNDFGVIPTLFPILYKIKVSYNKIESIDCLSVFQKSKITKIEVESNPFVSKIKNYSDAIFKLLPNLKIIDGHDLEGKSVDTTDYDEEEEEEEDVSFGAKEDADDESEDAEEGEEEEEPQNPEDENEAEDDEDEDEQNEEEEDEDEEDEKSDDKSVKGKKKY